MHPCAVSDFDGVIRFSQQPMLDRSFVANGSERRALTVPAVCLDTIVANHGLRPDFLKVDVEGHERQVFRGAQGTLRRCRPLIVFEALDSRSLEMTALEIRRAVPEYTFHSVHPGGALRPLPSTTAIPDYVANSNFVAFRPSGDRGRLATEAWRRWARLEPNMKARRRVRRPSRCAGSW